MMTSQEATVLSEPKKQRMTNTHLKGGWKLSRLGAGGQEQRQGRSVGDGGM
jgi:hypothetical protein